MSTSKKLPLGERQTALLKVAADLMLLGKVLDDPSIRSGTKKELKKIRLKHTKNNPSKYSDENGNPNNTHFSYINNARENPKKLTTSIFELSEGIFQLAKDNPEQFKQPDLKKILASDFFASIFLTKAEDATPLALKECASNICSKFEVLIRDESISENTKGSSWFNRQKGKTVNVSQTLEASFKVLAKLAPENAEQLQESKGLMRKAFVTMLNRPEENIKPELQQPSKNELKTQGYNTGAAKQENKDLSGKGGSPS